MNEQKIEFYTGPAGGWGALNSVKNALLRQDIPIKGAKTLLSANQPDGFDCPGCAWPDRNHASTFEFCENGVKAVAAEATARRAGPELFERYTVAELAEQSDFWLEDQGRLTHPMVYDALTDKYRPISWDEAFVMVARHLNALPDPNQAMFYTSGRASNEAAFLYQLFVREYGTNNFPDCSNMCHEPSGSGMRPQIGVAKGTVTLEDFEHAEAIFIFGQNPGTNHPRMLGELRAAHKRGAQIVSFNPLRERGLERFQDPQSKMEMATLGSTPISTHYFQLRGGGDLAAVKGMMKRLLERQDAGEDVLDQAFIAEHTTGFDALAADLRAESWELITEEAGLTLEQIHSAADIYAAAKSAIFCWGMGITQHHQAVATIQMMVNMLMLRGNLGREGAGACPVRGHSNVQGDRTMGIWEKPPAALLDRLQQVFGFEPPREHGVDTVEAIQHMLDGKGKVFFALGGNFAAATPDTYQTWKALRQCELTVHVTTKLNRSHIVHGKEALILPCLGRTEIDMQASGPQGVTVEDSMSMVHISTGINPPASELLLSEPAIVARLAAATLGSGEPPRSPATRGPLPPEGAAPGLGAARRPRSQTPWLWLIEDYARIRDQIEKVFDDFKDFNARVAVPGGFRLRNTASERVWATPANKATFFPHPVPRDTPVHRARQSMKDKQRDTIVFSLLTTRSHDQYNTTIYGMDDRYRGVFGQRRVVFINAEDIRALGLRDGDWVDLHTVWNDDQQRRADKFKLVAYDIPRGCLAAYYPETNPLVPLSATAIVAGTPTSKAIPVLLKPHELKHDSKLLAPDAAASEATAAATA
ncbi:FdhF/YdeP family oxidoreductase [Hydrogenophaga palleronii]|uniref:FdhF/YdeP family oxidoreductase n=1 Tax=Hydrogenophaga palleronii TaxID=65655 RepID=UPI0008243F17|nr:FdhF/YdeP family oxidoreductase [Hydrogenophaga palleronii]